MPPLPCPALPRSLPPTKIERACTPCAMAVVPPRRLNAPCCVFATSFAQGHAARDRRSDVNHGNDCQRDESQSERRGEIYLARLAHPNVGARYISPARWCEGAHSCHGHAHGCQPRTCHRWMAGGIRAAPTFVNYGNDCQRVQSQSERRGEIHLARRPKGSVIVVRVESISRGDAPTLSGSVDSPHPGPI
jgi:hypothetical protein